MISTCLAVIVGCDVAMELVGSWGGGFGDGHVHELCCCEVVIAEHHATDTCSLFPLDTGVCFKDMVLADGSIESVDNRLGSLLIHAWTDDGIVVAAFELANDT